MSTKVKGEAIKENSIPLNAICDSDSLSSVFNVGTPFLSLDTDDKYYIINNYKNYVYIKASGYNNPIQILKGTQFTLNRGPVSNIVWDENGIKIQSNASYYNVKVFSEIYANKADWNAQEGEAGYINNKLCHISFNDYRKVNYSDYDEIEELGDGLRKYKYYGKAGYIIFPVLNYDNAEQSYEVIHTSIEFQNIPLSIPIWANESGCRFADDVDGNLIVLELFEGAANSLEWFIPIYEEYENAIYSLPNWSIPETVLKTTPQILSDSDKNQALANLGIDKYIKKFNKSMYFACFYDEIEVDGNKHVVNYSDGIDVLIDNLKNIIARALYYNISPYTELYNQRIVCTYFDTNDIETIDAKTISQIKEQITYFKIMFGDIFDDQFGIKIAFEYDNMNLYYTIHEI